MTSGTAIGQRLARMQEILGRLGVEAELPGRRVLPVGRGAGRGRLGLHRPPGRRGRPARLPGRLLRPGWGGSRPHRHGPARGATRARRRPPRCLSATGGRVRPHPLPSPLMADLQATISALWDRRAELQPGDSEATADIHAGHRPARPGAGPSRRGRPVRRGDRPRVAEAGDPAAVPGLGDGDARGGPVRVRRQAAPEARFRRRGRAGGAGRLGPVGQLPRAGRHHDAELRQHRGPGRRQHHGRHVGHGGFVRSDRRQRPPVGRRRHRRRPRAARRRRR